jgi:hypothetical protein
MIVSNESVTVVRFTDDEVKELTKLLNELLDVRDAKGKGQGHRDDDILDTLLNELY